MSFLSISQLLAKKRNEFLTCLCQTKSRIVSCTDSDPQCSPNTTYLPKQQAAPGGGGPQPKHIYFSIPDPICFPGIIFPPQTHHPPPCQSLPPPTTLVSGNTTQHQILSVSLPYQAACKIVISRVCLGVFLQSPSLSVPSPSSRRFSGLRSLCATPWLCRYSAPSISCRRNRCASGCAIPTSGSILQSTIGEVFNHSHRA